MKKFTNQQRAIIAKKMGYDGPMQGFDQFLESSPALKAKYSAVTNKYMEKMAKGGMVKRKYAVGGAVKTDFTKAEQDVIFAEAQKRATASGKTPQQELYNYAQSQGYSNDQIDQSMGTYLKPGDTQEYVNRQAAADAKAAAKAAADAQAAADAKAVADAKAAAGLTGGGVTGGGNVTFTDVGGKPQRGDPVNITAATISEQANQFMTGVGTAAPTTSTTAKATQAPTASVATTETTDPTSTYKSTAATPAMEQAMKGIDPVTGQVSQQAQVGAATQDPTTSSLLGIQAAQTDGTQVVAPAERTMQAGEIVSGTAVDQARVESELAKTQAAQGTVSTQSTVQGQLDTLLQNFDAGNPPAWAASSMRAATAQIAARGLGSSSMAGQAIIQATMEASLPIASADAQVFQQMGLQNLSNRQQTAVLLAQQRAQFLGQEFDQTFQTKVLNASKVSDIANMNFSAQQQIALENARLAQTADLANLSNTQAVVMANAAQMATLETTNLNNRQQAAVVNAQSFLAMDMANMANEQQTVLFKAQQISQSLLTDAAADNAAKQFNSLSENQRDQFVANLVTQTSQFNSAQQNALSQFSVDQENSIAKFNAETQNARDQFNSSQRLVIDQSNAQWRREISTANTAATNASNYLNAQNLQQMSLAEYNNETQLYRDQIEMVWSSFEKDADRANSILEQEMIIAGGLAKVGAQADADADAKASSSLGSLLTNLATDTIKTASIKLAASIF